MLQPDQTLQALSRLILGNPKVKMGRVLQYIVRVSRVISSNEGFHHKRDIKSLFLQDCVKTIERMSVVPHTDWHLLGFQ